MRKEETVIVDLLHRAVPAKHTDEGLRALSPSIDKFASEFIYSGLSAG